MSDDMKITKSIELMLITSFSRILREQFNRVLEEQHISIEELEFIARPTDEGVITTVKFHGKPIIDFLQPLVVITGNHITYKWTLIEEEYVR
jgi:hypothetical protein